MWNAFWRVLIVLLIHAPWEAHAFLVVIDPGHGGTDLGTTLQTQSGLLTEKDVTLNLARQTAQQLIARGIRVVLTRTSDQEVALPARTALANRLGADAFISIHMNSPASPDAEGASEAEGIETFILNHTTDASSRRLAQLENSVLSGQGALPSSQQMDVALILKDLRLDGNLKESKRLACQVQENLVEVTSHSRVRSDAQKRDRGVKQALFHVLLGADMPSILVEAGFLSHRYDRAWALSSRGQSLMAQSIAIAVSQYSQAKRASSQAKLDSGLVRCKIR